MDITMLFKAHVKAVRTTNKSLGLKDQKSTLFKTTRDENLATAREVLKQITSLQNLLLENKSAYLNVINYLSSNKKMTELDRQQIDSESERIISTCSSLISDYRKEVQRTRRSQQKDEHYTNVVDSLQRYLKQVSAIYAGAKAVRVKRVLEAHKVAKLETKPGKGDKAPAVRKVTPPLSPDSADISAEELQLFESENEHLYNELNATSEEVKQMEGKVVHIAQLQELFTEKVLQQEQEIERISTNVVGATMNVKDANEQIRQSIQRNAGLRVWVLFFLVVMAFSLLFLDWYND